jgi:uncharacterized protein YgiM (DUF1202 family)
MNVNRIEQEEKISEETVWQPTYQTNKRWRPPTKCNTCNIRLLKRDFASETVHFQKKIAMPPKEFSKE